MAGTEAASIRLLIATPAYGGMVHTDYVQTLLKLSAAGIRFALLTVGNESLVTRARNSLLAQFHHLRDATHLLFLDADVGLPPEGVAALLAAGQDVIGAPVPLKARNARGDRVFNVGKRVGETGELWQVEHIGTAALLLSRKAVDALIADAQAGGRVYERPPNLAGASGPAVHYDVFQVGVVDGVYLSEDYWVCRRLRALGFAIHVLPEIPTRHHGVVSV